MDRERPSKSWECDRWNLWEYWFAMKQHLVDQKVNPSRTNCCFCILLYTRWYFPRHDCMEKANTACPSNLLRLPFCTACWNDAPLIRRRITVKRWLGHELHRCERFLRGISGWVMLMSCWGWVEAWWIAISTLREKLVVVTVLMLALGHFDSWTFVRVACQISNNDEWNSCKWCWRDVDGCGWLEERIAISILLKKLVDVTVLIVALRCGSRTGFQAFC